MLKTFIFAIVLIPGVAFADKNFVGAEDGTTWDCGSDPVVNVNYAATFTITGTCTSLNVNGSKLKVTAENVDELNVNGAKNAVSTVVLGAVNINGASNKVTYKKAKTGKKPKTAFVGRGNALTKVK